MLNSIGQKLKAARQKAGLSLSDAAHETRIPVARIQMLESDNFAAFGSMAYARSFLKNYSRFLNVDASEELDQFPPPLFGGPEDYRYLTRSYGTWLRWNPSSQPRSQLSGYRWSPVAGMVGLFTMLIVTGALVGAQLLGWQKASEADDQQAQAKASAAASSDQTAGFLERNKQSSTGNVLPDFGAETIVRSAVIPRSVPAPDTPQTPIRRPEIIE